MARTFRTLPGWVLSALVLTQPLQAGSFIRCPDHMQSFNLAIQDLEAAIAESNESCNRAKLQAAISLLNEKRAFLIDCAGSRESVIQLAREANDLDQEARSLMTKCSSAEVGSH